MSYSQQLDFLRGASQESTGVYWGVNEDASETCNKAENSSAKSISRPIGVFDSGMGGLSVLKALRKTLPNESFLYLGDTARLPYGTKSIQTVQQYAKQMTKTLIERGIKALVVACNTATTAALPLLQETFPELPIIGVLHPGAIAAVKATRNNRIFVLATETTIASNAYQKLILEKKPEAKIKARAANVLVALAEEGLTHHPVALSALEHYLVDYQDEDTLLLGCTHFPVFMPLIHTFMPQLMLIDPAEATAEELAATLTKLNLHTDKPNPQVHYLVTDAIERFQRVGEIFLEHSLVDAKIDLI